MASVKTKSPYQQGDLDMLCGVYSVLNIIQLLRPKSRTQAKKLFFKVLRHLEKTKQQKLSKTITSGLNFSDMKQLFKVFLTPENLSWENPFQSNAKPDMDEYWNTLKTILNSGADACVFIRLTGTHNHWTIVKSMTKHTMTLYDSDQLLRIYRRNCSIKSEESNKPHSLWPAQCLFIRLNNLQR